MSVTRREQNIHAIAKARKMLRHACAAVERRVYPAGGDISLDGDVEKFMRLAVGAIKASNSALTEAENFYRCHAEYGEAQLKFEHDHFHKKKGEGGFSGDCCKYGSGKGIK